MALSFVDFISQAMAQPSLFVILILVIGVTAVRALLMRQTLLPPLFPLVA